MVEVRMSMEEYMAMMQNMANSSIDLDMQNTETPVAPQEKPKKRRTAYQRKYKAAFKKLAPKYKLKSGKWKKGGFRTAVRLAHKEARK
tara:strand:+ start:163 stop:426 length:264 start_codon:yes stop_codon:yes gene_type:complete